MDYVDDLVTLLPELILAALVLVVITTDLFLPRASKWVLTPLTVAGLVLVGAACVVVWDINETVYAGFYVVDDLSVFLKGATVIIGILSALFAPAYLAVRRIPLGEFYTILVSVIFERTLPCLGVDARPAHGATARARRDALRRTRPLHRDARAIRRTAAREFGPNTAVLLGPDGKLMGKYRKVCLPHGEAEKGVAPGSDYPVFDTKFGKLGMMVCYDGFFPEVARDLGVAKQPLDPFGERPPASEVLTDDYEGALRGLLPTGATYRAGLSSRNQRGTFNNFAAFGGSGSVMSWGVDVDDQGNAYAAGGFTESMTAGTETFNSAGIEDAFVLKADPQGQIALEGRSIIGYQMGAVAVRDQGPDSQLQLTIRRNGEEQQLSATLSRIDDAPKPEPLAGVFSHRRHPPISHFAQKLAESLAKTRA